MCSIARARVSRVVKKRVQDLRAVREREITLLGECFDWLTPSVPLGNYYEISSRLTRVVRSLKRTLLTDKAPR
jgi:hypothetical protein